MNNNAIENTSSTKPAMDGNTLETNKLPWLEVVLETTASLDAESLEEILFSAGALSVTLTSKADEVILIEPEPGDLPLWQGGILLTGLFAQGALRDEVLLALHAEFNQLGEPLPLIAIHDLGDKVWEVEWAKDLKPLSFANRLWICPSQCPLPAMDDSAVLIQLDPGLAFGTGGHPTTGMVLQYLAEQPSLPDYVIDYGSGSGILGMAAAKLGAKSVVLTDIDAQALKISVDNAEQNQLAGQIQAYLPEDLPSQSTALLIANILYEPLRQLKPTFDQLCLPSGATLLLTGLLVEQTESILAHYADCFKQFTTRQQGDWAMIIATR